MKLQNRIRWKRTDATDVLIYCPNHEDLGLMYAREYAIGQSFDYSETNDLISNLKAPPTNTKRAPHKKRAIKRFAHEVAEFIREVETVLVPNPPSKTPNHRDYDDRILRVARAVESQCPRVEVAEVLVRNEDAQAASSGGERSVEARLRTLSVDSQLAHELAARVDSVVLLDDILTSGSSFEAARRRLEPFGPRSTASSGHARRRSSAGFRAVA